MKLLVIAALVAVALAEEPFNTFNYHENIGIPEATRIKQAEEARNVDGSRIAGGFPSAPGSQPYLAGLLVHLTSGSVSVCGGSLLSKTKVVTAAHCWWDGFGQASSFTVVLGSTTLFSGGTRVPSNDVEMHANWNPFSTNNDIAMVTIRSVEFTDTIQAIKLPTGSATYAGLWATASGFGRFDDSSNQDQGQAQNQAVLQVITNAACQQYYGTWTVVLSTLCTGGTGGVGLCGGDSGGPLVTGSGANRLLIGIASFSSYRGCKLGLPSGFTRVTSYLSWINTRIV